MPANKRLADLVNYTSVLPYASELFGVYQPLIGWRSRRRLGKIKSGGRSEYWARFQRLKALYAGISALRPETAPGMPMMASPFAQVGRRRGRILQPASDSILVAALSRTLATITGLTTVPTADQWKTVITRDILNELLKTIVLIYYVEEFQRRGEEGAEIPGFDVFALLRELDMALSQESAEAAMLLDLVEHDRFDQLINFFYAEGVPDSSFDSALSDLNEHFEDPFLTFDPTRQIKDATLSPVGVVHLFRQFFFELDSFLGIPVGHVWLSPGSTVELVEVSTRRTLVERTTEAVLEQTTKTERSTTEEDEISDAVKQDNKSDMKLGFSTTVNQSWGTGNATATGTLDLNNTQTTAREQQHKRSRQQSDKLSTEIRQNYKSTFKTVTETTDTSSKRYVLNNASSDLINYELRRKMRQVGVQIQDVGTYLCWETFVDTPGQQLSMPNLVHLAKPADLVLVPNPREIPMPPTRLAIGFAGEAVWNFPNNARQRNTDHPETAKQFVPIGSIEIPGIPPDYIVDFDPANPFINVEKQVIAAENDDSWSAQNWGFRGMITADGRRVLVGVVVGSGGLAWDDRITFKVSGSVACRLLPSKHDEIIKANNALLAEKAAADAENQRRVEKAYLDSVRDRIAVASKVTKRKFEDLREEERTIVYRNLIRSLMTPDLYHGLPETPSGFQSRHVLSELINAIFDVEKMLYFVAPEWWKPRAVAKLNLGGKGVQNSINSSVIRWANDEEYEKYFITEDSNPAPLGSSLGWLLQLDGDDLRNAFLNAPWVKAVIPIRPGKEQAAINWLKNVGVEGSDGLDAAYAAPPG